jgi:hypothetical protein
MEAFGVSAFHVVWVGVGVGGAVRFVTMNQRMAQ